MWQAVLASEVLGFLFLVAVTLAVNNPVRLAASITPIADIINSVLGSFVGDLLLILVVISIFACGLVILITGRAPDLGNVARSALPGPCSCWSRPQQTGTPLAAMFFFLIVAEVILAVFAERNGGLARMIGRAFDPLPGHNHPVRGQAGAATPVSWV